VRLLVQVGLDSPQARRIATECPDVELIGIGDGDPPPGLTADAFFGGYLGWEHIRPWIDATGVRWVQLTGTGADKVPAEVFVGRTVTCARGASAVPISEWVMAAILSRAKRMPETFLAQPPRHWNVPEARFDRVHGATLALIGLGGIGSAIATRALAFGMRVRALRRTAAPSPVPGVEVVGSLAELLPGADHVVLCAPATARTRHLLDAEAFARMTPGVHLVNIARGSLVDQEALRAALDAGTVGYATLDTVEPEPLPDGHWLYAHPQVRVAAHVSWYSPGGLDTVLDILIENLGRFASGEPLLHVVDPAEGY